jgi:hypothetical protein
MDLSVIHSHMRHLVFLLGALAFIIPLIAHLRKTEIPSWGKLLVRVYVITITIQLAIGLYNLYVVWNLPEGALRYRMEHAVIMLAAVGIGHYAGKFLKMPAPVGPRNTMIMMAGTVILIILGILMLPQGARLLGMGQ